MFGNVKRVGPVFLRRTPGIVVLSAFLTGWAFSPHPAHAQTTEPPPSPAVAAERVSAHVEKMNELGKMLKDRMRAGFPPIQTRQEAVELTQATFRDLVRLKAHYVLAKAAAKLTPHRDEERMRVRGVKNAYFPGDFLEYVPLAERLQKHVERFHVHVDVLEWWARYEKSLSEEVEWLKVEFEGSLPAARGDRRPLSVGEAVRAKLVEAAVAGDGRVTSTVRLSVRSLSDQKLTLTVPVWSVLLPPDDARQMMLVRDPATVSLDPHGSATLDLSTVCVDLKTRERPSQRPCVYGFGECPDVRRLAAAQNIIGITDLMEVKGEYSHLPIPAEVRPHVIAQLCIWRHLSTISGDAAGDVTPETVRLEIPLQTGKDPAQLSAEDLKAVGRESKTILEKMNKVLAKLDI